MLKYQELINSQHHRFIHTKPNGWHVLLQIRTHYKITHTLTITTIQRLSGSKSNNRSSFKDEHEEHYKTQREKEVQKRINCVNWTTSQMTPALNSYTRIPTVQPMDLHRGLIDPRVLAESYTFSPSNITNFTLRPSSTNLLHKQTNKTQNGQFE